jgi:hypothetical protein
MPLLQVTGNNLDNQEKNIPIKYYSDRFDVEQTSNLSLFLYDYSLVLMAKNQNGAVIASHEYFFKNREELKEVIASDTLINAANTAGKLYLHNNLFCIVPSMLFDPSEKTTYLNFSTALNEDTQEVFYEGLDSNNIQIVGAIDKATVALFDNPLPDMEITHGASLVLSYLLKDKNEMLGQEIFVVAEQGHIYLAAFASSELRVFNRFPVAGDQDFLKYTFSVLQQLEFDRMHCRTTLIGDIEGIHINLDVLNQYFNNLLVTVPKYNQPYSPGAEKFKQTKRLEAYWTA